MSHRYRSKTYRPGDPISSQDRTERSREVERLGWIAGSGGILTRDHTGGRSIALDLPDCTYIRLTSSANGDNAYAWKEVLPADLGTWVDSGRTGTASADGAFERNANDTLASGDRVYRACRAQTTGEWIFAHRPIGGGGSNGVLLGCQCSVAPATLTLTVDPENCGAGLLNSCTIQYGPTPSSLNALQLGANCYLSTALFPDPPTGDEFYYYFSCFSTFMRLSQAFPVSVFGSPWLSSAIFTWKLGDPGNTCSPFLLTDGTLTAAGGSTCDVTLSG
jgi:hypothetical protein